MNYHTFSKFEIFVKASLKIIKGVTKNKAETVFMGLSGGTTPLPVYEGLNFEDIENIEFFLVDERYVPLDDANSNYKNIREHLPEEALLHPIDTLLQPAQAARDYEQELTNLSDHPLDLVILGLGTDGHTASLFPHSAALNDTGHIVINTINPAAPNPPVRERITMTFEYILQARKILLLVSGNEKKAALEELLSGSKTAAEFPAKRLLEHPDLTIFVKTY
jgi:6-phosphogluconolactonase